jgi:hypothetical protein
VNEFTAPGLTRLREQRLELGVDLPIVVHHPAQHFQVASPA